ncbi:MAG: oligopeptidase A [Gammaproteobacteria bacterium]|nr:MAG: oligopeptidase A [Gammaproteobacteria bacterium]
MDNPLLNSTGLPRFTAIRPEHVEPAIDFLLADNRVQIGKLLRDTSTYTWDTLIAPIEALDERLNRAWSPVSHLNAVMNSEKLRAAYNACLPKLSDYATWMGQNKQLYEAYKQIAEGPEYAQLGGAQKKVIENALRDFHLSGVALPPDQQARYKAIQQELSALTAKFEENVLDATQSWRKQVTDGSLLAGLPDTARALARQTAEQKNLAGWVFTLDYPSYAPVLKYADSRELRAEMYQAYITRASDQGPHAGRWDNAPLMEKLLSLRHELAQLLGYPHFAALSLAKKMARSAIQVLDFLHDLARRAKPVAERELRELQRFARERHGAGTLEAWDVAYYSEKLRQHTYAVSQEELRPWFPLPRVLTGMFAVVERLYGLSIHEVKNVEVWHADVRFFEIRDGENNLRGQFYLDPYAREHKRGGAWMDECVARMRTRAGVQTPVAYLTCNFSAPIGEQASLLTHDEVVTLFHEFGHGLHHMLTRVDHLGVSGINGVAWDAVELPSQFMENWCWEREALDVISGHHQTHAPLPQALLDKMLKARNFQSGMHMVRQLEFALFDFRLHLEFDPGKGAQVRELLQQVRDAVAVVKPPEFERFANSFTHIFAGGYAAGYYSYLWAEVLSSDAYAKFEERGIFDQTTGAEFLHTVLEQGGARDALELFVAFRGREPRIDALLRHHGLAA